MLHKRHIKIIAAILLIISIAVGWWIIRNYTEIIHKEIYQLEPMAIFTANGKYIPSVQSNSAYHSNNRHLAFLSSEGIQIWDVKTKKQLKVFKEDDYFQYSSFEAIAYSPDGQYLAASSLFDGIEIWDVATGETVFSKILDEDSRKRASFTFDCISYSPDGKYIASGSLNEDGNAIGIWDVETGQEVMSLSGHTESIRSITYSPDNRYLASVTSNGILKLWDIHTGQEIYSLNTNNPDESTSSVDAIAFSPDGQHIATEHRSAIKIWDVTTGEKIRTLHGNISGAQSLIYSPDGHYLISLDSSISIWDVHTGHIIRNLKGDMYYRSIALSPDGVNLAVIGSSFEGDYLEIHQWRDPEHKPVFCFSSNCPAPLAEGGQSNIQQSKSTGSYTALHRQRRYSLMAVIVCIIIVAITSILVLGVKSPTQKKSIHLRRKLRRAIPTTLLSTSTEKVTAICYSPDSMYVAAAIWNKSLDNTGVALWHAQTGQKKTHLHEKVSVDAIAYSPEGHRLATGLFNGTISIWDIGKETKVGTLSEHKSSVSSISYSPNGAYLASSSYNHATKGAIIIWDALTFNKVKTLYGHNDHITSVAYSPNNHHVASASLDGTIIIWDIHTGEEIACYEHEHAVMSIAYSPEGNYIASGAGNIHIWDLATGSHSDTLSSDALPLFPTSIAYSPDGSYLAAGSTKFLKMWEVSIQKEVLNITSRKIPYSNSGKRPGVDYLSFHSLAYSPNGKYLVSIGERKFRRSALLNEIYQWATPEHEAIFSLRKL